MASGNAGNTGNSRRWEGVFVETFGQAVRRLRGDLSLREVARRAHIEPGHLSRIESGKRQATGQLAAALDEALKADGFLVDLAAADRPVRWRLNAHLWRPADAERLASEVVRTTPTAENAVELTHQWLITQPPQVYEVRAGRRIGVATVEEVERRVHQLRRLDDHVGGKETWAMVTGELAATLELFHDAAYTEAVGRRLLVAVGELCQVAGWVSSDAGRFAGAERMYLAGVHAAHAGGDVAGAANNLSSLAYQMANVGDPRRATTLARSAYVGAKRGAKRGASATTLALLAERVAWAHARTGESSGAERALALVETEYDRRRPGDDPTWVYWLDEQEIEIMAGRVDAASATVASCPNSRTGHRRIRARDRPGDRPVSVVAGRVVDSGERDRTRGPDGYPGSPVVPAGGLGSFSRAHRGDPGAARQIPRKRCGRRVRGGDQRVAACVSGSSHVRTGRW
jgi:transcriptional regulator with XRE-family HTH domain